jgi:hypothetical protein
MSARDNETLEAPAAADEIIWPTHDANHLQSAKTPPRLASERGDLGHVLSDGHAAYFWSS